MIRKKACKYRRPSEIRKYFGAKTIADYMFAQGKEVKFVLDKAQVIQTKKEEDKGGEKIGKV